MTAYQVLLFLMEQIERRRRSGTTLRDKNKVPIDLFDIEEKEIIVYSSLTT